MRASERDAMIWKGVESAILRTDIHEIRVVASGSMSSVQRSVKLRDDVCLSDDNILFYSQVRVDLLDISTDLFLCIVLRTISKLGGTS